MGIQDDIFDVEAALEGKPEAKFFDDIMTWAAEMETELLRIQQSGPFLEIAGKTYIQNDVVRAIIGKSNDQED